MDVTSRITSKSQTTVPREVRVALGVGPGDEISYEIRQGNVIMRKAKAKDAKFLKALESTLSEWNDPADDVFNDL